MSSVISEVTVPIYFLPIHQNNFFCCWFYFFPSSALFYKKHTITMNTAVFNSLYKYIFTLLLFYMGFLEIYSLSKLIQGLCTNLTLLLFYPEITSQYDGLWWSYSSNAYYYYYFVFSRFHLMSKLTHTASYSFLV